MTAWRCAYELLDCLGERLKKPPKSAPLAGVIRALTSANRLTARAGAQRRRRSTIVRIGPPATSIPLDVILSPAYGSRESV